MADEQPWAPWLSGPWLAPWLGWRSSAGPAARPAGRSGWSAARIAGFAARGPALTLSRPAGGDARAPGRPVGGRCFGRCCSARVDDRRHEAVAFHAWLSSASPPRCRMPGLHALHSTQSHRGTPRVLLDLGVAGAFGAARQRGELWSVTGEFDRQ